VIGHVGSRVSALVDGQLPPAEAERLWAHVHTCPVCHAQVEREGWIKTQLVGFAAACPPPAAPHGLRGALAHVSCTPTAAASPLGLQPGERRRMMTLAAVGAGSIGAAMVGVIALSVPAEAPGVDRRGVTSITQPSESPRTPVRTSTVPVRPQRVTVDAERE
jgi:anti-sigma factor RsiW